MDFTDGRVLLTSGEWFNGSVVFIRDVFIIDRTRKEHVRPVRRTLKNRGTNVIGQSQRLFKNFGQ